MPEHSPIINVEVFPGGNQSWTAVMGANAVRLPTPYGEFLFYFTLTQYSEISTVFSGDLLDLHDPGCAMWMSREEYM